MSLENQIDPPGRWRTEHQEELTRLKNTNGWPEIDRLEERIPDNLSDKPHVVFDPMLGGFVVPQEFMRELVRPAFDEFGDRMESASRFEKAREGLVALGYVGNLTIPESPAPFIFAFGAFVCAQLEKREFGKARGVVEQFRVEFLPNQSDLIRGAIVSKDVLPYDRIERNDGNEVDYFIPTELIYETERNKAELAENVKELGHKANLSVLTLTGASVASIFLWIAAAPFVAYHLKLSSEVKNTTSSIKSSLRSILDYYPFGDNSQEVETI